MNMTRRLRYLAFCVLACSALFAAPVLADEEAAFDEGESECQSNMQIQYRSNTSQGAAQTYCETISCGDVCTVIGCSGGGGASAATCSTCNHDKGGWTYAAHGYCSCSPKN